MWQRIEFTPEEERALEATDREMAERWPLERLRAEASAKKTARRSAPKTPRKRREQPDPEDDWSRRLREVGEAVQAAETYETLAEALTRLSAIMREGAIFFTEP